MSWRPAGIAALALAGACATTVVGACATAPTGGAPPPPPKISLTVQDVGQKGWKCGRIFRPRHAGRPAESRVIARITVTADGEVPLEALEQVMLVEAVRRCAAGVAVLQASAVPGATGFLDATGELWDTEPPESEDPERPSNLEPEVP